MCHRQICKEQVPPQETVLQLCKAVAVEGAGVSRFTPACSFDSDQLNLLLLRERVQSARDIWDVAQLRAACTPGLRQQPTAGKGPATNLDTAMVSPTVARLCYNR